MLFAQVRELQLFADAYKFRSSELLALARYRVVMQSPEKNRRPAALPEEDDVGKLKTFLRAELRKALSENAPYVNLRYDCVLYIQ